MFSRFFSPTKKVTQEEVAEKTASGPSTDDKGGTVDEDTEDPQVVEPLPEPMYVLLYSVIHKLYSGFHNSFSCNQGNIHCTRNHNYPGSFFTSTFVRSNRNIEIQVEVGGGKGWPIDAQVVLYHKNEV